MRQEQSPLPWPGRVHPSSKQAYPPTVRQRSVPFPGAFKSARPTASAEKVPRCLRDGPWPGWSGDADFIGAGSAGGEHVGRKNQTARSRSPGLSVRWWWNAKASFCAKIRRHCRRGSLTRGFMFHRPAWKGKLLRTRWLPRKLVRHSTTPHPSIQVSVANLDRN